MATATELSPTRTELMKLRKRESLAKTGHDLLEEKMDALIMELFSVLRRIQELRGTAFKQLEKAHRALSLCLAAVGTKETLQAAREGTGEIEIDASTRNLMGIVLPSLEKISAIRTASGRGYCLHSTSAHLDTAAREFEAAVEMLVPLAEAEADAMGIADELERTKRRVNALEYILIPRLREAIKFIVMRLDEIERENFARLKRIKKIMEERGWERRA
ncbi:MAG: V-type ATP synthase subunit D [Candidatus Hadarchaeales archaeon]